MWREEPPDRILLRKKAAWTAFYDPGVLVPFVLIGLPFLKGSALFSSVATTLVTGLVSSARPKYGDKLRKATKAERDEIFDSSLADGRQMVDLTIRQNGIVTGSDTGALWEKNGVLIFKGVRSSFRLTKRLSNLSCRATKKSRMISFVVEQHFEVELTLGKGSDKPVDRWFGASPSKALNVLPPLTLAPEIAQPKRYAQIQLAVFGVACLVLALTRDAAKGSSTVELYLFFLVATFLAGFFVFDYRRLQLKKMIEARPWLARYSHDPVRDLVGAIGNLAATR